MTGLPVILVGCGVASKLVGLKLVMGFSVGGDLIGNELGFAVVGATEGAELITGCNEGLAVDSLLGADEICLMVGLSVVGEGIAFSSENNPSHVEVELGASASQDSVGLADAVLRD